MARKSSAALSAIPPAIMVSRTPMLGSRPTEARASVMARESGDALPAPSPVASDRSGKRLAMPIPSNNPARIRQPRTRRGCVP
jgi:hypothetical protein